MRILRGKSNLEVSSRGFALFVLGLILATFIGGAVRTLSRSDRLHNRVLTELRTHLPNHNVKIGRTEVLLADGIWPALGVQLFDVSFRQDMCDKPSVELTAKQMTMPLDIWAWLWGNPRLARVVIIDGQAQLGFVPCVQKSVPKANGAQAAAEHPATIKSSLSHFDWRPLTKFLRAIEVRGFNLTWADQPDWLAKVNYLYLSVKNEMSARANVTIQKLNTSGLLSYSFDLEGQGEGSVLDWRINSEFKEGRTEWRGSWDMASNSANTNVQFQQIPVKELMTDLHAMGWVRNEAQLKGTWITCGGRWEGQLQNFEETPIRLQNCTMEGAYGRVTLDEADLYWSPNFFRKPVELNVEQLQLQPIFETLRMRLLPTVLARVGVWSGKVEFLSADNWSVNGFWDNLEISFSNQSVRGKQSIQRLKTQVQSENQSVRGKLDNVRMVGGDFDGEIDFDYSVTSGNGSFRTKLKALAFSLPVQKLLSGGAWTSLHGSGQGTFNQTQLQDWNGQFETETVSGTGWKANGLTLKTSYKDSVFNLDILAQMLVVDRSWRYFSELQSRVAKDVEFIQWKDLSSRFAIHRQGGELKSFRAQEHDMPRIWRARGQWLRNGIFSAQVSVGADPRMLVYNLQADDKGSVTISDAVNPPQSP